MTLTALYNRFEDDFTEVVNGGPGTSDDQDEAEQIWYALGVEWKYQGGGPIELSFNRQSGILKLLTGFSWDGMDESVKGLPEWIEAGMSARGWVKA